MFFVQAIEQFLFNTETKKYAAGKRAKAPCPRFNLYLTLRSLGGLRPPFLT
jgi:hypothetical protein